MRGQARGRGRDRVVRRVVDRLVHRDLQLHPTQELVVSSARSGRGGQGTHLGAREVDLVRLCEDVLLETARVRVRRMRREGRMTHRRAPIAGGEPVREDDGEAVPRARARRILHAQQLARIHTDMT